MRIKQDSQSSAWICEPVGLLRTYEVIHLTQFIASRCELGTTFFVLDLSSTRLSRSSANNPHWAAIFKSLQHPNLQVAIFVLPEAIAASRIDSLTALAEQAGIADKLIIRHNQDEALGLLAANA